MASIFISYRREDSAAYARLLSSSLKAHFGARHQVFMDLDSIEPGEDFVDAIKRTVASCDVLIAIIGKQWLASVDEQGRARLQNPEDFVRVEIQTALDRKIRVIPALVGGARMPGSQDFPLELSAFARRNAFPIHDDSFAQSMNRLIESLDKALAEPAATDTLPPAVSSATKLKEVGGSNSFAWRWRISVGAGAALALVVLVVVLSRPGRDKEIGREVASSGGDASTQAPKEEPQSKGSTVGQTRNNPKDGLTYVWIPPGRFTMGCSQGDGDCDDDENPAHEVTISKGFWLGQTEVTQEAYERATGKNPSGLKGAKLPVDSVTWTEGDAYCRAVGGRLPSEAEWEYAARAGSMGSRYGDIEDIAWYDKNSGNKTHEVARKSKNAWGLYDLLGNAWEWVADLYGSYPSGSVTDPRGPLAGSLTRVLRGGSWNYGAGYSRASFRVKVEPEIRSFNSGFRCAAE